VDLYSNEKQVTAQTPPAFLTHALDDTVVVPENSRLFYNALKTAALKPNIWSSPQAAMA
jgi:dipeptidyl aminopeptidase/acylaminoacyl peptidase